jgi:UDP-glucose 4-epimerase
MKRVLITGAGSYVGSSVESWLRQWPESYRVDTLDMIGDSWRAYDFRGYDAVLHVAGIVHREDSKKNPAEAELYDRINHRLAVETAQAAKTAGVKQFLFMSSASVYGITAPMGRVVTITKDTPPCPVDNYGRSKADAEKSLAALAEEGFRLAVLRPPMIYGKGCKGNYQTLSRLARKLPVFPWVENRRSMLYMDNLSELIRLLIDEEAEGIFCPQNEEYVNTCDMVNLIAHTAGKNILMIHGFGWALKLLRRMTPMVDKAFGSLCYDRELSAYPGNYCVKSFEQSVLETERE